jgi:hypothetical protein
VNLVGVFSNRGGFGARVRVVADGVTSIREIPGGSGFSQDAPIASFGLGASVAVDSLWISWPSGLEQFVLAPVDQQVTVVESFFTDLSSGPEADAGSGSGVAWGDYDGDGDVDLYLVNAGANKLLRNDGTGGFADATAPPLGDAGPGHGAAWGDYDEDGDPDLYLSNAFTANKLFRNDGPGGFADVTVGPLGDAGNGRGVAWADYDNDGDLDLYLANFVTANKLFRNDAGAFVDASSAPLDDTGGGNGVAWGDYDNDGDLDLYLANYGAANKLFRNDGAEFVDATNGLPLGDPGQGHGVTWGDYDNDGDLDLYLSNFGANKLLRNDGGGEFADVTASPLDDARAGTGVDWGDCDNDGDLDLYLANLSSNNKLFRNDGGDLFIDIAVGGYLGDKGYGRGVAWGDYDNDGDLDLYFANEGQANKLLRNDLVDPGHWLKVSLAGVISNRAGIGARVRVVGSGVSRIREITGGSGYLSQSAPIASFGLGPGATIDSVIVMWPSGIEQVVTPVPAVDQQITVVEAVGGPLGAQVVSASAFERAIPNPFASITRIEFTLSRGGPLRVDIISVTGRRVTTLADRPLPTGRHRLTWDGRDATGAAVANGVYFVRVESQELRAMRKIVKMR